MYPEALSCGGACVVLIKIYVEGAAGDVQTATEETETKDRETRYNNKDTETE